jgi:hypothetical protein
LGAESSASTGGAGGTVIGSISGRGCFNRGSSSFLEEVGGNGGGEAAVKTEDVSS